MQMRYGKTYTVIGVTDNVIMTSPFEPAYPMMMVYDGKQFKHEYHAYKNWSAATKSHCIFRNSV